jgi:hypothetical protein
MNDRLGDCIQTYTGKQFYPLDVRQEDIDIEDVAHALSMKCRYNGHCRKFYSVAEHSVYVARELECRYPADKNVILWGLLHDAGEAYLPDTPSPIKHMGIGILSKCEEDILKVISKKYDLSYPPPVEVKKIDNILLMTERAQVMAGGCVSGWNLSELPIDLEIIFYSPMVSKTIFLSEFNRINNMR